MGANVSRCEIEGYGRLWGGAIVQKQSLYYCSATPPASSCTQEHRLKLKSCCLSLVPFSGSGVVPVPLKTIGPLLAFGPGSVHVSSASSVTCCFWDNRTHREFHSSPKALCVWLPNYPHSGCNYWRPTRCVTRVSAHFTLPGVPQGLPASCRILLSLSLQVFP